MTDGNTAFHVGPVLSEGEMKSFQDMFARIANTITQASELSAKFTDLSYKVDEMAHSLEVAQARNTNLDDALTRVRTERDELSLQLSQAKANASNFEQRLTSAESSNASLERSLQDAYDNNKTVRVERDDAQFQVLTLTEELDKTKAVIEKLYSALGISKPHPEAPKAPEPIPTPAPETTPLVLHSEPVNFSEPLAQPTERRKVWQGDPEYSNDVWYEALPNEYGYDQETDKRWYYADAKRS